MSAAEVAGYCCGVALVVYGVVHVAHVLLGDRPRASRAGRGSGAARRLRGGRSSRLGRGEEAAVVFEDGHVEGYDEAVGGVARDHCCVAPIN